MIYILLLTMFLVYLLLAPRGYSPSIPNATFLHPDSTEEAAIVRRRVASRTAEETALFQRTDSTVVNEFAAIVPELDGQYLDYIVGTHNLIILALKYTINRLRPYQLSTGPAIDNVLPSTSAHTPAFPSGHSYQSFVLAKHLAKLFPDRRDALFKTAESIGQSRIAAGHHFPSDHAFGKKLALTISLPQ